MVYKKIKKSYIFTKKHENKREVFQEDYLEKFVLTNAVGNIYAKMKISFCIFAFTNINYKNKNTKFVTVIDKN